MEKTVRLGAGECGNVYCKITWADGRLSISGVEGPMRNGNCKGSCGQIKGTKIKEYAPEWSAELVQRFYDTWEHWHLNDMRAGCEHQRAGEWSGRPIDPNKPLNAYGKFFEGQKQDSWNMLAWVRADEYPDGLLSKPCPVCGYKYGTAWLKEEVPQDVIDFLFSLPENDGKPAWI